LSGLRAPAPFRCCFAAPVTPLPDPAPGSPWCGPCRVIAPIVEELASTYAGKIKIGKLNVDDHPQVAAKYRVMNIPTLLLFKGGEEVDRIVGAVPKEELSRRIEQVISA